MRSKDLSVLVVIGLLVAVLIQANAALAATATPGSYTGTTDQLCPPFAIARDSVKNGNDCRSASRRHRRE